MTKLSLIAKLTTDPDRGEEFDAALAAVCEAANEEAGLEIYSAHRDNGDAGVYWFFELYTDADALGVHGKGDGMKSAMGALGSFLTGPAELHMATPVAAKGLDL